MGPVHAQDGKGAERLQDLRTRFRELVRESSGAPNKTARMALLRNVARIGDEKAMQFLADVARGPRHADIYDDVMRLIARAGSASGVAAALFREHLGETDPHRRLARDFLLKRAVERRDDGWLKDTFFRGQTEDRFLALEAMGSIGSTSTLRSAWTLLRNRKWKTVPGTVVSCATIARAVRTFEGGEAARLLLLLRRDRRFRAEDSEALREAMRLWATGNLRDYVKISDLAHPDAAKRAESARFMGDASIEAARAPLLVLARKLGEHVDVRAAAAEALGGLTIARGALTRDLARLLTDPKERVRQAAVAGLARLRVKDAVVVLVKLVGSPLEMHARAALAAAYGQEADQDWKEWLRTCGLPQGT